MPIMRRKDKELDIDDATRLLIKCKYGILSTVDNNGQPYGVPLNYVYKNGKIYFHCALNGHKIENIKKNPKVSFCVIGNAKVLPSKFSTEYKSAVVFGTASEVQGKERYNALLWLLEKYSPEFIEEGKNYINKQDQATKVIKVCIEHMTGKQSPAKSK